MKKTIIMIAFSAVMTVLSGCASTSSTVFEFDPDGKVVKETRTTESVMQTLINSTKNKSVVLWEDSLTAYMSVSGGTVDDPTPHGKIFAGKVNRGAVTLLPDQEDVANIAKVIHATKSDVELTFDKVSSSRSEAQSEKADVAATK